MGRTDTDKSLPLLLGTAATIGFVHTVLGPDHYLPFIVLSKARGWTARKTAFVTALAGFALFASGGAITFLGL